MKYVGAHVSISGGLENAPGRARKIGAHAFALFTKNQRQWQASPLTLETIARFQKQCLENDFTPEQILPHDSYLINLGHPGAPELERSRTAFIEEIQRCRQLGLKHLNFHPGSHLGRISEAACLKRIADSLNLAHAHTGNIITVIENTAGQGTNLGFTFEQIARIMEQVKDQSRAGVCLDTAHTFAAGYDLRTRETWEQTMEQFASRIGFQYLRGVHLNDSRTELGSRVDRHESLGRGALGLAPFRFLMNDARFENLPLILETRDSARWEKEIELLYNLEERPANTPQTGSPGSSKAFKGFA